MPDVVQGRDCPSIRKLGANYYGGFRACVAPNLTRYRCTFVPALDLLQTWLALYLLTSVQGFKGIKNKDFGYGGSRAGGMG